MKNEKYTKDHKFVARSKGYYEIKLWLKAPYMRNHKIQFNSQFMNNNDEHNDKDDKPTFQTFCDYYCGNDCWKNPYGLTIVPYFFGLKACIRSEANSYVK